MRSSFRAPRRLKAELPTSPQKARSGRVAKCAASSATDLLDDFEGIENAAGPEGIQSASILLRMSPVSMIDFNGSWKFARRLWFYPVRSLLPCVGTHRKSPKILGKRGLVAAAQGKAGLGAHGFFFLPLTGLGKCLMASSKSFSTGEGLEFSRARNFSYSASAFASACSWEIFPA